MTRSCRSAHMQPEDGLETRPLRQIIAPLRRLRFRVEFPHEAEEALALPRGRDRRDADWVWHQPRRIRAKAQKPAKRMDVAVGGAVGMEGELGFGQPDVRGDLARHGQALQENAVSGDRRKTASMPSPVPNARSFPSCARYSAQKPSKSLS